MDEWLKEQTERKERPKNDWIDFVRFFVFAFGLLSEWSLSIYRSSIFLSISFFYETHLLREKH